MADGMSGNDFEDNLQIACAIVNNIDVIVTRDPEGFQESPIRVITASDLLQQLSDNADRHDAI
jgi:hypothetical protein